MAILGKPVPPKMDEFSQILLYKDLSLKFLDSKFSNLEGTGFLCSENEQISGQQFGAKLSQKFWVKIFLIITNNVITFVFILTTAGGGLHLTVKLEYAAPLGGYTGALELVHTLVHTGAHTC